MDSDKILLSCVNTKVSLVGIDLNKRQAFWYTPSNVLRSCGICYAHNSLYVSTDNILTKINASGISYYRIPGQYDNYAHSVKVFDDSQIGVVDTGNSKVILFDGQNFTLSFSPLENWENVPLDAIHVNDFLPWHDGILVSAFSYQPFTPWKQTEYDWQHAGWGCLYHLKRFQQKTVSRIVCCGLQCPHSITLYNDALYCCASASGDFIKFTATDQGLLYEERRFHVCDTHFLRGAMRYHQGWLLGGSSHRHAEGIGGLTLFYLSDEGSVDTIWQGGSGEIYDILPWHTDLMQDVSKILYEAPIAYEADVTFPEKYKMPEN